MSVVVVGVSAPRPCSVQLRDRGPFRGSRVSQLILF